MSIILGLGDHQIKYFKSSMHALAKLGVCNCVNG